jgi:hypothetical protein
VTKPPVLEVKKNSREVVRVQPTTYNGIDLVDARVWTVPVTPEGESKPTRKGLTLQPATWTEVLRAVQAFLGSGSDTPEEGLDTEDDPFAGDV